MPIDTDCLLKQHPTGRLLVSRYLSEGRALLLISNEKFSLHDVIYEKDNEYRQVLELGYGVYC